MNQVDQTKTFSLSVTPPSGSGVYAYIWKFWDGTVAATTTPRVEKKLNIGGNPADSRKLYFTCQPVMEDGQSTIITGSVQVNNPPYVVPSPEISKNDEFFPYATQIKLTAYDVEGDALSFLYYQSDGTPLGGGTTTYVGAINGTWNGTMGTYDGYQNVFETTITAETSIALKIVDAQNGTREVDFDFYGEAPPLPILGVTADSNALTADATSLPNQRIGPGQEVNFTVYAADPVSSNFNFLWSFYGSNGWRNTSFSTGTSAPTADGSVRNAYTKDISHEFGGDKVALVSVKNTDTGKEVEIPITVTLISNNTATECTFTVKDQDGNAVTSGSSVAAGTRLVYSATVDDPQDDVVAYKWTFTQPGGLPTTLRLWGREVVLDTTGFTSGGSILVTLLAVDRMEGQVSFTAPMIKIS